MNQNENPKKEYVKPIILRKFKILAREVMDEILDSEKQYEEVET